MSTIIKSDITTMRKNLIREKEEQQKKREEEKAIIRHARVGSTLYDTKQWKRLRNWYIMHHPLCEIHLKYGISKPAQDVHHMIPWSLGKTEDEQRKLCFDEYNLLSVCRACHNQLHSECNFNNGRLDDCVPPECVEY